MEDKHNVLIPIETYNEWKLVYENQNKMEI